MVLFKTDCNSKKLIMPKITYKELIDKCHSSKKSSLNLYYWHRLLSAPITIFFYRFNIQPNFVSFAMILLSFTSFLLMCLDSCIFFWTGYGLAFLAFLFDKVDGDLARLYGIDNIKGAVLDFVYHRFSLFLFYLGIAIHYSYESKYVIIIASLTGFIANYIEEMQLLPYRVYAHKFIIKRENISEIQPSRKLRSPLLFKLAKSFRVQLFLFYYFIIAIILNKISGIEITFAILLAFLLLLIYSVHQLFITLNYSFDKEIKMLEKQNRK